MRYKIVRDGKRKDAKTKNFKATIAEERAMQDKADRYFAGNVSDWIRYATIELEPRKEDLEKIPGRRKIA